MSTRSLGTIRIDLVALTAKFDAGIKASIGTLSKFGTAFTKAGTMFASVGKRIFSAFKGVASSILSIKNIITGAVIALAGGKLLGAFQDASETVDTLGKKAKTVGLTIEQMSVLKLTADEAGVEFESLYKLVGKAQMGIAEFASTGGGPAAAALRRLRLDLTDGQGKIRDIADMLPEIASKLSGMERGDKLRIAKSIFGKDGGTQFVQMLEDSGNLMAALGDETDRARKLGVLFTESQFKKLKDYNDAVGRIGQAWLGFRVSIMSEVAPMLTELANTAALVLAKVGRFGGNLMSVIREAIAGGDMFEGVNVAMAALKRVVSTFFAMIWAEVITRIEQFFRQLWEFIKIIMEDLFSKIGQLLTDMASSFGGMIGTFLGALGEAFLVLMQKIGPLLAKLGKYLGKEWEEAGNIIGDYREELEKTRTASHIMFNSALKDITTLGEKYRKLRGEAEETSAEFGKGAEKMSEWGRIFKEFFEGAREGWEEMSDAAEDFRALGKDTFSDIAHGISGGFASAMAKGEMSFKNFGKSAMGVITDVLQGVTEMIIKFLLFRAIVGAMGSFFGGGDTPSVGTGGSDLAGSGSPTLAAKGGVFGFKSGGVASGVLNGPTPFGFNKKIGVAGEAGGEVGFSPLRKIGGELGVKSVGGGTVVQIFDQRSGGDKPEVSRSKGANGQDQIRVLIRDTTRQLMSDGALDKTMGANFAVGRKGARR